jgi:hypothetical protein
MNSIEEFSENKYQKSVHNKQCIGPCYETQTISVHPLTLEIIRNDKPSCLTNEWKFTKPNTGETKRLRSDHCEDPVNSSKLKNIDLYPNLVNTQISLICSDFLLIYYNIKSINDTLLWINNHPNDPIYTKLRLMECALLEWGLEDNFFINNDVIAFYITVIKQNWIKYFYKFIKDVIHIDKNNKIYFKDTGLNKEQVDIHEVEKHKVEKINFIIKKFINYSIINEFFIYYIKKYKKDWYKIKTHNNNIKLKLKDFILNKIKKSIN